MSLSNIRDPRVLRDRLREFRGARSEFDFTPGMFRQDVPSRVDGFTKKDLDQLIAFVELRLGILEAGGGGTGGSGGGPGDPPGSPDTQDKFQKMLNDLRVQREELLKGEEAAMRLSLAMQGLTDAQVEQIIQLDQEVSGLEESEEAREEAEKKADAQARAVQRVLETLKEENVQLRGGERALLAHQLAADGATEAQVRMALATFDANEAMRDSAEAARKLREEELAELEAEFDQLKSASDRMADVFTDGLLDMVAGTEDFLDAFEKMVDGIISELLRLTLRKTITEPLANALAGAMTGGGSDPAAGSALNDQTGISVGSSSAKVATPVINQNLSFPISTPDAATAVAMLRQHKGEIIQMVAEGARESTAFRRLLRG